jgi:hypothetical protein
MNAMYGEHEEFVTLICENVNCKKEFVRHFYKRNIRFCSHSCASSGENNGLYGKPGTMLGKKAWSNGLTTQTDDRLKLLGEKISSLMIEAFASGKLSNVGENNPNYGRTRDTRTQEQLDNYSKAAVQRVLDGKSCSHIYHHRGHYTSLKTNVQMFFRSSYELRLMICFDLDQTVVSYEHESIIIKYDDCRRYIPDFLVTYDDNTQVVVEAKPLEFVQSQDVIKKSNAGIQYCIEHDMSFEIMTNKEISELEDKLGIEHDKWKSYI